MKYIRRAIFFSLFLMVAFFIFMTVYYLLQAIWVQGGEFISQPSAEIRTTAEYLYVNPNPTPSDFEATWFRASPDESLFCVTLYATHFSGAYPLWIRLFLNGELVPRQDLYQPGWLGTYRQFEANPNVFCLDPDDEHSLAVGLHLLEIQFKESPLDTGITYIMAIHVEPLLTPIP